MSLAAQSQEDKLLSLASDLVDRAPEPPSFLGAGIMAAAALGLAEDSRSFARKLEIAHALVLRECVTLAEDLGLIEIDDRQDRSQRLFFKLSDLGRSRVSACVAV